MTTGNEGIGLAPLRSLIWVGRGRNVAAQRITKGASRDVRQCGGQVVLRAPKPKVARMLAWMGMAELLPIVNELPA
jgi:hypothetical protein